MAVLRSFDVVWREESSLGNLVSLCASSEHFSLAQLSAS